VIESASESVVLFPGVLVEFVFTSKAIAAPIAAMNGATVAAILRVFGANMAVKIRFPREAQVAVRIGAPAIFDMPFEVLFKNNQILECFARLSPTAVMPAAAKCRLILRSFDQLRQMDILMGGQDSWSLSLKFL